MTAASQPLKRVEATLRGQSWISSAQPAGGVQGLAGGHSSGEKAGVIGLGGGHGAASEDHGQGGRGRDFAHQPMDAAAHRDAADPGLGEREPGGLSAITRSQDNTISKPPPMAWPCTAAISGLVMAKLRAHDVPASPVNGLDAVLADPQVVARGVVEAWDHPVAGPMNQPSHPIKFGGHGVARKAAPTLGQDTDAVLAELGYGAEKIAELRWLGAVT